MRSFAPALAALLIACSGAEPIDDVTRDGGVDTTDPRDAGTHDAGSATDSGATRDAGSTTDGGNPDAGTDRDGGAERDGGLQERDGGDTPTPVAPPTLPGPYTSTALNGTAPTTSTNDIDMSCLVPSQGPSAGPYPVVLVLHGFRIDANLYDSYVERLASHGFVACTADFAASVIPNHVESAQDILEGLDWVLAQTTDADPDRVALVGHSLGGKLAVYGASMDPTIDAIVGLDPVDGAMLCNATRCPDATDMLPVSIPTAFLGQTLDRMPGLGGQACTPTADSYTTFYTPATSPSLEVTMNGASHMSFVDDLEACGFVCSVCQEATMAQADALAIARAYTTAFLLRHVVGDAGYDSWLTGADANVNWIAGGAITVQSK
ncbi:MAG: alpha/beta hydrolase [Deltaproteobacteria bacterium]|jgi:chlorophyllase